VERGASAPSARTVKKEKEGGTGGSVSTRAVRGKWEERGGPGVVVPRGGRTGRERQGVQRASDRVVAAIGRQRPETDGRG
jgi:hypothetical protein